VLSGLRRLTARVGQRYPPAIQGRRHAPVVTFFGHDRLFRGVHCQSAARTLCEKATAAASVSNRCVLPSAHSTIQTSGSAMARPTRMTSPLYISSTRSLKSSKVASHLSAFQQ
jgi:hypothetical protein